MLSFFEFHQLLGSKINEAGPDLDAELSNLGGAPAQPKPALSLAQRIAQRKAQQQQAVSEPAALPTAPAAAGVAPEAPVDAAKADILKKMKQAKVAGPDVNDPTNPNRGSHLRQGLRPSRSQAMKNTADSSRLASLRAKKNDNIQMMNSQLKSPSYQSAVAMGMAELGIPGQVPAGPFMIRTMDDKEGKDYDHQHGSLRDTVVMDPKQAAELAHWVNDYFKSNQAGGPEGMNASLRQAIDRQWTKDSPEKNAVVLRAKQFEKAMHDPSIAGQEMTLGELASTLGSKSRSGGLEGRIDDMAALHLLIQTAMKNGFEKFFEIKGDISNPNTRIMIRPLEKLGAGEDPLAKPNTYLKSMAAESTDWTDLMDMMEHWGF